MRGAPRPIAELVNSVAAPAMRRFGFAEQRLITHWRAAMGESLGGRTLPIRLRFPQGSRQGATLYIRADAAAALDIQHLSPQIIERINTLLGYGAVAELRIQQGPVPRREGKRPIGASAAPALPDPALDTIGDIDLRTALYRLKAGLAARRSRT